MTFNDRRFAGKQRTAEPLEPRPGLLGARGRRHGFAFRDPEFRLRATFESDQFPLYRIEDRVQCLQHDAAKRGCVVIYSHDAIIKASEPVGVEGAGGGLDRAELAHGAGPFMNPRRAGFLLSHVTVGNRLAP